uniref:cardiolipin synthase (CMP-forming) n=1 Tax=Setaria digitata TaxID=48799 RepID=A0A915PK22_9BILA
MFRRVHLAVCREVLPLAVHSRVVLLQFTTSNSSAFPKSSRDIRIDNAESIRKVKRKLDENGKKSGNNIATVPNALSFCRIGLTPIIGYLIMKESYVSALATFVVGGITDWLDGYIARNFENQGSLIGSIIDPVADKLFVTTLVVTLSYVELMPISLAFLIILRDAGLVVGGAVIRYKTVQRPVTFSRYFSPSVSPLQVTPTFVSKVNTVLQMCTIAGSLTASILGFTGHPVLASLYFGTAVTTVYSGLQYARLARIKPVKKI